MALGALFSGRASARPGGSSSGGLRGGLSDCGPPGGRAVAFGGVFIRPGVRGWVWGLLACTLVLILPLADLVVNLFSAAGDVWRHMASTVLMRYVGNTVVLSFGVLAAAGLFGTGAAWFMAQYHFPGKSLMELLLVLPMAVPPYISAYAWSAFFDYGSPTRGFLNQLFRGRLAGSFRITTMGGLIIVMASALYPYVYVSLRHTIRRDVTPQLEAARILGHGPSRRFFTTVLPLARPAAAAGLGLVLMEVLNEYGAVSYFGIDTLTTGIFRAWFGFYDLVTARRIGGILLTFVFIALSLESAQRRRMRFYRAGHSSRVIPLKQLRGWSRLQALPFLLLPPSAGLVLPLWQLIIWASRGWRGVLRPDFAVTALNSLLLALGGTAVILTAAVFLSYARRIAHHRLLDDCSRPAFLGYAIPGAVIALGVMHLIGNADRILTGGTTLILSGSLPALIYAYTVRYLALAQRPVSAVLEERYTALDEASRTLGRGPLHTLFKVHLPNMGGVLTGAGVIVFIDIIRELPLTMILRPFNLNTLAVTAYELAANEQMAQSALPALILVLLSAGGVGVLHALRRDRGDEA